MVGLHVYHNVNGINKYVDHTATLQLEEFHEKTECYNNGFISISYSYYKGYPINQYIDNNVIIILEGMIYNRTNDEVICFCKSLAEQVSDEAIKELVGDFVESSDGDYIIMIYLKSNSQYIIFNDLIGRLPFYYYFDSIQFIAGRSIPFILHNMPRISIDKNALTEFLMKEFIIGNNTFFKDIIRLAPAEILFVKTINNHLNLISQITKEESFDTINAFKNKEEAIESLYQEYKKNTQNRIEKFNSQGYSIFNTLSGGFDSRSVFGIINKITQKFTNVTYEYSQDESVIALKLLERTNSKSDHVKLSFNNEADYLDSSLIFRTGGCVNIYTTSFVYNDQIFMKKKLLNTKDVVIGGFGGEFLRHPYRSLPLSSYTYLCYYLACIPIHKLTPVLNVSLPNFKKFLMSTLKQYNEKSNEGIYKHLYNEYYRNYVVGAGEDRMRMLFWTNQPLMSTSFMQIIRKRIPLKWANYQFFTDFLSKVDSRLLDIPIFGTELDLHSKNSIKKLTPITQKIITRSIFYTFIKKYGWLYYREHIKEKNNSLDFEKIDYFYRKLDFYKNIFNYAYIKKEYNKWPLVMKRRLLTIVMYLYELEKHYKNKLLS